MPSLPATLPSVEILLALIALVPVLIAWAFGLFSSAAEKAGVIRMGNPLLGGGDVFDHDPAHEPVLHLSRTESAAELRDLALGLRNAPVEKAAPLLKHFMQSTDPELALFAQSILQQGRERLQATCGQLQNHQDQTDPRIAASLLESSLRLVSPALSTTGEREGRLQQLAKKAGDLLAACEHTPRFLAACVRAFLAAGIPEKADSVLSTLPHDSALRHTLEPEVRFAMSIRQSAAAL